MAVSFSEHQGGILWAGDDELSVYKSSTQTVNRMSVHTDAVLDFSLSRDRTQLLTAGRDGKLAMLNLEREASIVEVLTEYKSLGGWVTSSVILPGTHQHLLGHEDGSLIVIDILSGISTKNLSTGLNRIENIVAFSDQSPFVSLDRDGRLQWWSFKGEDIVSIGNLQQPSTKITGIARDSITESVIVIDTANDLFRSTASSPKLQYVGSLNALTNGGATILLALQNDDILVIANESTLTGFDLKRLRTLWTTPLQESPTAITYDHSRSQILVAAGSSIDFYKPETGEIETSRHQNL